MAANKKGLQMVQREGSPSDLCFCHFDHLCENSVISTGITFVTSTNIAASFFEILWNKISSSRWRLLAGWLH
jgi:hypothetical protein